MPSKNLSKLKYQLESGSKYSNPSLNLLHYGSEVWGPLLNHEFEKWDKNPIETLNAEFCKNILRVQRNTPNNACRAELGQYPLIMRIEKRANKFWKHLKMSYPNSYHFTFTFMHLADAFIQSDLVHSGYTFFLSVRVFPGNRTHNLCAANAML